jgi:ABC-type transport system substrate-binding protein
MERAAFFSSWPQGKLKGLVFGGLGPAGNAATRLAIVAVKGGPYAAGVLPEVQDLYDRQARERDHKKREELLHQIQRILFEKKIFAPIWENGFIRASGPRVEEPGQRPVRIANHWKRVPVLLRMSADLVDRLRPVAVDGDEEDTLRSI